MRSERRHWLIGALLLVLMPWAAAQPMPGTVIDLASGQPLDETSVRARITGADRILLGERHDLPADHAAERWLLQAMQQQRPARALVLEMISSDRQARLRRVQRWIAKGNRPAPQRLAELLDWDPRWPWAAYGGLVRSAADNAVALFGGNLARHEVDALLAAQPVVTFPMAGARQRLSQAMLGLHAEAQPLLEGMLAVQQARDQRMATVLQAAPAPALLVAGRWHVLRGTGVPGYLPDGLPVMVIVLASPGEALNAADADLAWVLDDE